MNLEAPPETIDAKEKGTEIEIEKESVIEKGIENVIETESDREAHGTEMGHLKDVSLDINSSANVKIQ